MKVIQDFRLLPRQPKVVPFGKTVNRLVLSGLCLLAILDLFQSARFGMKGTNRGCKENYEEEKTFMKKHLLSTSLSLAVFWLLLCPRPILAITPPPTNFIAERLGYIVALRSFSPAHPLTQDRLMKLVIDLGRWGDFPQSYLSAGVKPPNCDACISRNSVRRFIQGLTGQDLQKWGNEIREEKPRFAGNQMGWWYNSGNTMYQRPIVHVISERLMPDQTLRVTFHLTHQQGNEADPAPYNAAIEVGHGSATLKRERRDWIVTSWQVDRNSHWNYNGSEALADSTPPSSKLTTCEAEVDKQVRFLMGVPRHATLRQIQLLLPRKTLFGKPDWVQSLSEWGNFVTFVGPLNGSAVFLDRTKPYHGMREKYTAADAINYIAVEVALNPAQENKVLEAYAASITRMVRQSPKVERANGNGEVNSLEWTLSDGRNLIFRSHMNTLKLTFPDTIEGEPGDQQ